MTQVNTRSRRSAETKTSARSEASASEKTADAHHRVVELAHALTALKANTAELLQRKRQLQQLNRWFDIALNNMGRGLSMFDGEQRLIVATRFTATSTTCRSD